MRTTQEVRNVRRGSRVRTRVGSRGERRRSDRGRAGLLVRWQALTERGPYKGSLKGLSLHSREAQGRAHRGQGTVPEGAGS